MKTASKASIREQWQRTQPDEFISDRKGKRRRAQGGGESADRVLRVWLGNKRRALNHKGGKKEIM